MNNDERPGPVSYSQNPDPGSPFDAGSNLLFRLFQDTEQIPGLDEAPIVKPTDLINTLNHLHFTEKFIRIHLRHRKYGKNLFIKAFPEPCHGERLTCRLSDETLGVADLKKYRLLHLVIDDGLSILLAPAELADMARDRLHLRLSKSTYRLGKRRAKRFGCQDITVDLSQSGFRVSGRLIDFSPLAFRIRIKTLSGASFYWFNLDQPVHIHLERNGQLFFSGVCRCIRQAKMGRMTDLVASPMQRSTPRTDKHAKRNQRQRLISPTVLVFDHPFLARQIQLEILDISTSGFSVVENKENSVLLPGMILPEATLHFPGEYKISCKLRVIYHKEENDKSIRCGLAILDMGITDYSRLADVIINSMDPCAHVSRTVNSEKLWELFFASGFIYPNKYAILQEHRKAVKETYKKLYEADIPEISRHFTYEKGDRIYAHLAMVRAFEQTWLLQHFAAKALDNRGTGFKVLKFINTFVDGGRRLPSVGMDYLMAYFRPDNKVPERVFGGFAEFLDQPEGCSTDTFAYFHYPSGQENIPFPGNWSLTASTKNDIMDLTYFYENRSGGLLLEATLPPNGAEPGGSIESLYGRYELLRRRQLFSLSENGELCAVLVLNQSPPGINLSDILNSITVLVTNPVGLTGGVLKTAIGQLAGLYGSLETFPVLIYPAEFAEKKNIACDRQYRLWILNLRYGVDYTEYIRKRFKL